MMSPKGGQLKHTFGDNCVPKMQLDKNANTHTEIFEDDRKYSPHYKKENAICYCNVFIIMKCTNNCKTKAVELCDQKHRDEPNNSFLH